MRDIDPRWTERPDTGRDLDPLSVTTVRNRILSDLLFAFVSNAITQRIRYLSFWAWCLDNLADPSRAERSLYEKIFLFAALAHDCPDENAIAENGLVGATRTVRDGSDRQIQELYDPDSETIDISADRFTLAGNNESGFDMYYAAIMIRLLLLEDSATVSPLGRELAAAYDATVDVEFDALQAAVSDAEVSTELLDQLGADGCPCTLSDREQELLTKAFLGMVTRADSYDDLALTNATRPDQLQLRGYLGDTTTGGEDAVTALVEGDWTNVDRDEHDVVLRRYLNRGFGTKMRASVILFLRVAEWLADERGPATVSFGALEDARAHWRLLVHTDFFVHGCESLFIGLLGALRELEPITAPELLTTLTDTEAYGQTIRALCDGTTFEQTDGEIDTQRQTFNAIYYGDWFDHPTAITVEDSLSAFEPFQGSWADLQDTITHRPDPAAFELHPATERGCRTFCDQHLAEPGSVENAARIAGAVTVLCATLQTRYTAHFSQSAFDRYRSWFASLDDRPSPAVIWGQDPDSGQPIAEWFQQFTQKWILDRYFEVLYQKIRRGPSKAPQHLSSDHTGQLSFERLYSGPNLSNLKFDRMAETLYELGLVQTQHPESLVPTDRGRQLTARFLEAAE